MSVPDVQMAPALGALGVDDDLDEGRLSEVQSERRSADKLAIQCL